MHHSYIDKFSHGNSPVHRLDARAKLLIVLAYTGVLISFGRYEVAALAPMSLLPAALLLIGDVPVRWAMKRVFVLSPFILLLCVLSPVYDRAPQAIAFGPWRFDIAGGWLTCANIALKFTFGLLALTALVATTPFALLLEALGRMGVPPALVMQLGFLYRYLFVLIDEGMRLRRARDFRGAALAPAGRRLTAVGGIIGSLFVRSLERAERVHLAMQSRGHSGVARGLHRLHFGLADLAALMATAAYLALCRGLPARWI
jgi:cobalt/nickel transport system permease protein